MEQDDGDDILLGYARRIKNVPGGNGWFYTVTYIEDYRKKEMITVVVRAWKRQVVSPDDFVSR